MSGDPPVPQRSMGPVPWWAPVVALALFGLPLLVYLVVYLVGWFDDHFGASPQRTAIEWLDALNSRSIPRDRLEELTCSNLRDGLGAIEQQMAAIGWPGSRTLNPPVGDDASVRLSGTLDVLTGSRTVTIGLLREVNDGPWCVSVFDLSSPSS